MQVMSKTEFVRKMMGEKQTKKNKKVQQYKRNDIDKMKIENVIKCKMERRRTIGKGYKGVL